MIGAQPAESEHHQGTEQGEQESEADTVTRFRENIDLQQGDFLAFAVESCGEDLLPWPDGAESAGHDAGEGDQSDMPPPAEEPADESDERKNPDNDAADEDGKGGDVAMADGLQDLLVFAHDHQQVGSGNARQNHGADGDGPGEKQV